MTGPYPPSLTDLEQPGGALAAADAHGDDDALGTPPLALDQRVAEHARAAHPIRVADGDGAAVDVQPVRRQAEPVAAIEHLARERLVQLPKVDVVHREPVPLQQTGNGIDRPDPHLVRLAPGDGEAAE